MQLSCQNGNYKVPRICQKWDVKLGELLGFFGFLRGGGGAWLPVEFDIYWNVFEYVLD